MQWNKRVGIVLRETRTAQHKAGEQIARIAGWTGTYIRYIENGNRTAPCAADAPLVALTLKSFLENSKALRDEGQGGIGIAKIHK